MLDATGNYNYDTNFPLGKRGRTTFGELSFDDILNSHLKRRMELNFPFKKGLVRFLDDLILGIDLRDEVFRASGLDSLFKSGSALDSHDLQSLHFVNKDGLDLSSSYRLISEGFQPLPVESHENSSHIFQDLRSRYQGNTISLLEVSRLATKSECPMNLMKIFSQLYQFGIQEDVGAFVFGMSREMFDGLYSSVGFEIEGEFDRYETMELPCVIATWEPGKTAQRYKSRFERGFN